MYPEDIFLLTEVFFSFYNLISILLGVHYSLRQNRSPEATPFFLAG
jgi:hypothetical protein